MASNKAASLTLRAVERLRSDIVQGEFSPCERLNIEHLKRRYDMGATPVREALNQLVGERFVEALALKGFQVAPVSLSMCCELIDARLILETDLVKKAMLCGDDLWESQCMGAHFRWLKYEQSGLDWNLSVLGDWFERYHYFLQSLAGGADSTWLLGLYLETQKHIERYHYTVYRRHNESPATMLLLAKDYRGLVQAVIDRDISRVIDCLQAMAKQSLDQVRQTWVEVLA